MIILKTLALEVKSPSLDVVMIYLHYMTSFTTTYWMGGFQTIRTVLINKLPVNNRFYTQQFIQDVCNT